jgi:NADH-quinone oxidoreductase subunit A
MNNSQTLNLDSSLEITNSVNGVGVIEKIASAQFVSNQFLPVLLFLAISIGLSIVIILIPFIINKMRPDQQKNSPYECGFEGQGKVRSNFTVQFYLVAILFIIFDLEIAFLFPWAVVLREIGVFGYSSMMIFLGVLTVGFIYEWKRGALEWK